jgi:hypothetical protein
MKPDRENQTESLEISMTKEMKEKLQKISLFKSSRSITSLARHYIRQGLKEDESRMKREQDIIKGRQAIIDAMTTLICGPPCPHCELPLEAVETSIFSSWSGELIALCTNDDCPYFSKSWEVLREQGTYNHGYRYYRDQRGSSGALPVGPTEKKQKKLKLPKICKKG